jgi:hypothetical protein
MYRREGLKARREEKKNIFSIQTKESTHNLVGNKKHPTLFFFGSNRGAIPFLNTSAGRHDSGQEYMTRKGKKFKRI